VKKILVVDDQVSVRRLIEMALVGKGLEVIQADSGEQAVEQVRADAPDLVIMDVMMPGGMDGYATIAALRELSCDCAVLMLTAKNVAGHAKRALMPTSPSRSGCMSCLTRWNRCWAEPLKVDVFAKKHQG